VIQNFLKRDLNHSLVSVVLANREPHIVIVEFHGKGAIFKRHPRGPEFPSAVFGQLPELQRRMTRVCSLSNANCLSARLQIMLVKPTVQLFPLLWCHSINRTFNLLHRV
jgi:hypothetical protein